MTGVLSDGTIQVHTNRRETTTDGPMKGLIRAVIIIREDLMEDN